MKYKMEDGRILSFEDNLQTHNTLTLKEERNGYVVRERFDAYELINAMELISRLRNENLILTLTEDTEYNRHFLSNLLDHGHLEEIKLDDNKIDDYLD